MNHDYSHAFICKTELIIYFHLILMCPIERFLYILCPLNRVRINKSHASIRYIWLKMSRKTSCTCIFFIEFGSFLLQISIVVITDTLFYSVEHTFLQFTIHACHFHVAYCNQWCSLDCWEAHMIRERNEMNLYGE